MTEHPRYRPVEVNKADEEIFTWDSQASQYPADGPPGISHLRVQIGPPENGDSDPRIECLLYRDESGKLVGILNYFPVGVQDLEKPGAGALFVHPEHRRQGIATALSREWLKRWDYWDEGAMTFSASGAAFVNGQRELLNSTGAYPDYDPARHRYLPIETEDGS